MRQWYIYIYPKEYFNPYNVELDKMEITDNTRSIHHFAASWKTKKERFMEFVEKQFGGDFVMFMYRMKHFFIR